MGARDDLVDLGISPRRHVEHQQDLAVLEVVLEARPEQGRELTQEDLDRAKEIIEERVNKTGVSEPEIRKQGDNQISVSLPGVHDTARAARLIGQTATLEFYNLQGDALSPTLGAQGQIVASPQLLPLNVVAPFVATYVSPTFIVSAGQVPLKPRMVPLTVIVAGGAAGGGVGS